MGQYLWHRRNCSNCSDFKTKADKLSDRFRLNGYNDACLKPAFKRASDKNRQDLIFDNRPADTNFNNYL